MAIFKANRETILPKQKFYFSAPSGETSKLFKTSWKPNMINDMIFWGDANSRNIKSDNNGVYYWKDNSGKMNHGYQTNNKPTHLNNIINGFPALYFNNIDSIIVDLSINYFTIITVTKVIDDDYIYEFGEVAGDGGFYLNGDTNSLSINNSGLKSQKSNGNGWFSGDWEILTHKYGGTHESNSLYINNQFINYHQIFMMMILVI